MSIVSAIKPTSGSWLPLIAWGMVVVGLAAFATVIVSATAGIVTGVVLAVAGLVANAMAKASRKMDRIFAEELD